MARTLQWLDVKKIRDTIHIQNHKDKRCRELYSPETVKLENPNTNTMFRSRGLKVLGSNPSWIPDFSSVDLFLTVSTTRRKHTNSVSGHSLGIIGFLTRCQKPTTTFISTEWLSGEMHTLSTVMPMDADQLCRM